MISVRNLWKRYGATWALRGISFDVSPGSIFGLIGPNGAGKTTTLRILSTSMAPTFGDGLVCGQSVVRRPQTIRPLLGFMPELFSLYDDLYVWEYLDFFATAYLVKRSDQQRVVDEVIQLTDLEGWRDAYVGSLSKGLRQRVLLAKSLIHDPKALLLDEPASGVDPRGRIELRSILKTLAQMGKTVIISSHILTELSEICDAIGVMEKGRMVVSGPVSDIMTRISPGRTIKLLYQGEPEALTRVLNGEPGVDRVNVENGSATFQWRGDDNDKAKLVSSVVGAGLGVLDFHEESQDLEDLFLRLSVGGPS